MQLYMYGLKDTVVKLQYASQTLVLDAVKKGTIGERRRGGGG